MKSLLFNMELARRQKLKAGLKETHVLIFDLKAFSLASHGSPSSLQFARALVDVLANHYPESLERAIVIDAPLLFTGFWALLRPALEERSSRKVVFISGEDAKQALGDLIEEDLLYERYGGRMRGEKVEVPVRVEKSRRSKESPARGV